MCGAFSDKWLDVAQRCGKQAEALKVDWGSPIRAEAIDKKLATGEFDALTLIQRMLEGCGAIAHTGCASRSSPL